jgi:hypothetical protein
MAGSFRFGLLLVRTCGIVLPPTASFPATPGLLAAGLARSRRERERVRSGCLSVPLYSLSEREREIEYPVLEHRA